MLCHGLNGLYELLQSPTRFAVVKTDSKVLHAFYTLCRGQNGLTELLHASYTLCSDQNGISGLLYKPPIRFALVKTD